MASYNVQMSYFNGTSYDELYPKASGINGILPVENGGTGTNNLVNINGITQIGSYTGTGNYRESFTNVVTNDNSPVGLTFTPRSKVLLSFSIDPNYIIIINRNYNYYNIYDGLNGLNSTSTNGTYGTLNNKLLFLKNDSNGILSCKYVHEQGVKRPAGGSFQCVGHTSITAVLYNKQLLFKFNIEIMKKIADSATGITAYPWSLNSGSTSSLPAICFFNSTNIYDYICF